MSKIGNLVMEQQLKQQQCGYAAQRGQHDNWHVVLGAITNVNTTTKKATEQKQGEEQSDTNGEECANEEGEVLR